MTSGSHRPLTDTTWAQIAARLIDAAGIAPYGDLNACRWIALRHARDHIHLVATLVRQDGRIPELRGNWHRMRETRDQIEAELELAQHSEPADKGIWCWGSGQKSAVLWS
ncbi:hypothetical protein [Nonomuraea gerenzanensis]|uniref:Mobilization protein n=1 Tax=Nonomuraea gerenzanensis TaxID=93944 RepID=A0A1M4EAF5_9ACTN|nr:hypothetical protein [Nonomuraea gerenzanensis]UBU18093.1 hypothetical protein LCN96_24635 [Nonomuraea gerenzanensis]SBO95901.1 hypothetical protein BN4615_P5417 [Nonomuraea gerenzanensis]